MSEKRQPDPAAAADPQRPPNPAASPGEAATSTGSSDEDIGRPADWREGRYQQAGEPLAGNPPAQSPSAAPDSTGTQTPRPNASVYRETPTPPVKGRRAVTREDYE